MPWPQSSDRARPRPPFRGFNYSSSMRAAETRLPVKFGGLKHAIAHHHDSKLRETSR